LYSTKARSIPHEVSVDLSSGDTLQKVHSVLGNPLIDDRNLGLEVYRIAGRDIDYYWVIWPIPWPFPGDKAIAYVLVVYDEHDVVMEIASDIWDSPPPRNMWITAGKYHLVSNWGSKPDETLLGPAIPWENLTETMAAEDGCTLVLINGKWGMEQVSLDEQQIADLSGVIGGLCTNSDYMNEGRIYCKDLINLHLQRTFIRRDIASGTHRLSVHQKVLDTHRHAAGRDFETVFECEGGETVYAEIKADFVPAPESWWWHLRIEGDILISKKPSKNVIEMGELHPILWYQGTWYVPPISSP
jgi:hypothetical protein